VVRALDKADAMLTLSSDNIGSRLPFYHFLQRLTRLKHSSGVMNSSD